MDSTDQEVFTKDLDKLISDQDIREFLPEQLQRTIESHGSVVAWISDDGAWQEKLRTLGFQPPLGEIIQIHDPNHRVRWWNIEKDEKGNNNRADEQAIQDIEEEGSTITYVDYPRLRDKFERYHFTLPLSKIIEIQAERSEYGPTKENQLLIA